MSAVMVAVFSSFGDAESVRTELIRDGFPPTRVELTATSVVADSGTHPETPRAVGMSDTFRPFSAKPVLGASSKNSQNEWQAAASPPLRYIRAVRWRLRARPKSSRTKGRCKWCQMSWQQ